MVDNANQIPQSIHFDNLTANYTQYPKNKDNPLVRMHLRILLSITRASHTEGQAYTGSSPEELDTWLERLPNTFTKMDLLISYLSEYFDSKCIIISEEEIRAEAQILYTWLLEQISSDLNGTKQQEA